MKKFFSNTLVKFAAFLFILAIILSISNPVSEFLYKLGIWGGSSITMNRVNFMMNFSLAILGAYGLSALKNSHSKISLKPAIWILLLVSTLAAGLLIGKQTTPNGLFLLHINIALRNLILPTSLVMLVLFSLFAFRIFKPAHFIVQSALIFVLVLELFRFGWKFNTFSSPSLIYPETPISQFLEKYPNDRFVAEQDIFPENMWVPFRISSIEGYDGIYPLNMAKLLAVANSGDINSAPQPRWGTLQNFDSRLLDVSNVRFVLAVKKDQSGKFSENGQIDKKFLQSKYKKVFEDKSVVILENSQALPRVYLTNQVIRASDQETLKLMLDEKFPIEITSITNDFEFNNPDVNLDSTLTYNQATNSHVLIKAEANDDAYLVVLETFYPGWRALIDGKETKIYRTNYNFRGIFLPKGDHIVEFIYSPKSLKYGTIISGISALAIIILLIYSRFSQRKV